MANNDNLTGAGRHLSTEEAQRNGQKGGKASARARREKKALRESFEAILSMPLKSAMNGSLYGEPDYVTEWWNMCEPYFEHGELREDAPKEAKEAFEKYKAWAWEQPQ